MKTATELRNDLLKTYVQLTTAGDNLAVAHEKAYVAVTIIKSALAQLKYAQLRKETPNIPFLK